MLRRWKDDHTCARRLGELSEVGAIFRTYPCVESVSGLPKASMVVVSGMPATDSFKNSIEDFVGQVKDMVPYGRCHAFSLRMRCSRRSVNTMYGDV